LRRILAGVPEPDCAEASSEDRGLRLHGIIGVNPGGCQCHETTDFGVGVVGVAEVS